MCLKPRERLSLGRFAERLLTCLDLSAAEVPCETAPFASFSGRAEKGGPARPERVPIYEIVLVGFRWRDFILFARCKENEARETRVGECPPRPPRTALRQRAVERHVKTCSAKRLQTHRLTAVQTRSLFVSPLREEIPSRATPPVWRNAALAYRYLTAAQWLSGYEGLQKPCVARR